jgi:hypothetical protein
LRRVIIACLLLLSVIAGCTTVSPVGPNEVPVAYIDSVSANTAIIGDVVSFRGHGTDQEGNVVAYEWRSSIDGVLSTMAEFSTSDLSVAKHTIYFKVQDNIGDWSKEVFVYVNVVATHFGNPVVNIFEIDPDYITAGDSAVLRWDIAYADSLVITPDIGNVSSIGTRTVYPQQNTTYVLTATNEQGQIKAQTRINILINQTKVLELYSIPGEDGTVKRGAVVEFDPMVGGDKYGTPMQAFLSFDISMIPSDAVIQNVTLDISNHATYGYPFNFLGALGIYHDQYGTLDGDDYHVGSPGDALYYTYTEPWQPYASNLFVDAVQEEVNKGSSRFQVRLEFEKYYYDENKVNYIALNSDKVRLTVTYE